MQIHSMTGRVFSHAMRFIATQRSIAGQVVAQARAHRNANAHPKSRCTGQFCDTSCAQHVTPSRSLAARTTLDMCWHLAFHRCARARVAWLLKNGAETPSQSTARKDLHVIRWLVILMLMWQSCIPCFMHASLMGHIMSRTWFKPAARNASPSCGVLPARLLIFRFSSIMSGTTARMSDAVKAQCYAMRQATNGEKPMSYRAIAEVVKKTDNTHPNAEAVRVAIRDFMEDTPTHRKLRAPKRNPNDGEVLQTFSRCGRPAHHGPKLQGFIYVFCFSFRRDRVSKRLVAPRAHVQPPRWRTRRS